MGVSFSSENSGSVDNDRVFQAYLEHRSWLRYCAQHAALLVTEYLRFNLAPFISKYQLECFVTSALRSIQSAVVPTNVDNVDSPVRSEESKPLYCAPQQIYSNDTKRHIVDSIWAVFNDEDRYEPLLRFRF
jgi:hypothetical protein